VVVVVEWSGVPEFVFVCSTLFFFPFLQGRLCCGQSRAAGNPDFSTGQEGAHARRWADGNYGKNGIMRMGDISL
jgi:hypothetical protein